MKKLFALLLILTLSVLLLASCASGVDEVKAAYANSAPSKITVISSESFGSNHLQLTTTIHEGALASGEIAAIKTVKGQRFRSIEEGSGDYIYDYIEDVDTSEWYRATKGTSSDKGKHWDYEGESFIPAAGLIAINLDASLLQNVEYDGKTLTFTVKAANASKVFSDELVDVVADISCKIVVEGAEVSSIEMGWTVPAAQSGVGEDIVVSIKATYEYVSEFVTLK